MTPYSDMALDDVVWVGVLYSWLRWITVILCNLVSHFIPEFGTVVPQIYGIWWYIMTWGVQFSWSMKSIRSKLDLILWSWSIEWKSNCEINSISGDGVLFKTWKTNNIVQFGCKWLAQESQKNDHNSQLKVKTGAGSYTRWFVKNMSPNRQTARLQFLMTTGCSKLCR